MGGVEFLDHLHAGPAVLGDLVNIGALHQPQAYIRVPQAVSRPRLAIAVHLEVVLGQYTVEQFQVAAGEHLIGRLGQFIRQDRIRIKLAPVPSLHPTLRFWPVKQALVGPHGASGAFAEADATLAPNLNLQNFLTRARVRYHRHVAVLQIPCLVRPHAGVAHEQNIVVQLVGIPLVLRLRRVLRVCPRRRIKLLIFRRAEPGPVHNLPAGFVGRRQIRQMRQPAMPDAGLQDQAQRADLVMDRAARRSLTDFPRLLGNRDGRRDTVHTVILYLARRHARQSEMPEEWQKMQPEPNLMPLHPAHRALTVGDHPVLQGKPLRGCQKSFLGRDEARACLAGHGEEPVLRHILGLGETFFLRAVAELFAAYGGGTLPEATGRFLEKLEIAVHQLMDRALDRW